MRKLLVLTLAMAGASWVSAQEQTVYPIDHAATTYDSYGDAVYYYSGGSTYNLLNYPVTNADSIICFKVGHTGKTMAVATTDRKGKKTAIAVFDLWNKNKKIAEDKKLKAAPVALDFTSDDQQIIASFSDNTLRLIDAVSLKGINQIETSVPATAIKVSPRNLAALTSGNIVKVLRLPSLEVLTTLTASGQVTDVAFSDDAQQMAVLAADGKLEVFETTNFGQLHSFDALGDASACSFNSEGKHIAVVSGTNRITIMNLLNPTEREFIDSEQAGISYVKFIKDPASTKAYLIYNTDQNVEFLDMSHLSPLRSQLIADRLEEMMNDWEQMLPGETLEEYQLRVNDQTRLAQSKLFEQEIANELALSELGMAQMELGSYNPEMKLMAINLGDGLGDIFLSVPESDVAAFLDPNNLEFRNVRYGLNDQDEFTLLYADVYNKANGQTYTYDNLEGQFIDYMADDTFAPLEIVNQTSLEESSLADLTENIVNEAKSQNILSDHTHITVSTKLFNATNAQGDNERNYEVNISYTVDEGFSAQEDYGAGKYELKNSPAGMAMMQIVKQAMENDFSKYLAPGKTVNIEIEGTADATPIKRTISYNGCYGDYTDQPVQINGEESEITVTTQTGISSNEQLAFLRAVGVKEYLFDDVKALDNMNTDVKYVISVSDKAGSQYRKVSLKFTFIDAFEN